LTRHLNSTVHKESCEVFHASKLGFPAHLKFPVVSGYSSRVTYTQLYNCPFVREWEFLKSLNTRKARSVQSKTKDSLRNSYLGFQNEIRLKKGKKQLEHMKDSLELQEADASFKFMYTRLRRRSIQKPTKVVKLNVSTSERRMGALKKRVRKQVMKDRNEDCCTLTATKAEETLESSLLSLQNDSDPQGYAR
jgi:hypothetical protein